MGSRGTRTRLISRGGKKVREHRWLMEQSLGRTLLPREHVHHINGDPLDNRLENLVVLDAAEHMRLHKAHERTERKCSYCGQVFVPWQRQHKRQRTCSPECALKVRSLPRRKSFPHAPSTSDDS